MARLFEVQLVVGDVDHAAEWYQEMFSLTRTVDDAERRRIHLALNGGQLILAEAGGESVLPDWPGVPPALYQVDDMLEPGPTDHEPIHFALQFESDVWESIADRLRDTGSVVRGPLVWPDTIESLYTLDPDGNCVEIVRAI